MEEMTVTVTKLHKILKSRAMNQTDLEALIKETNNGKCPAMWILNELINGKKKNPTIKTLRPIKQALGVTYDDIIDD